MAEVAQRIPQEAPEPLLPSSILIFIPRARKKALDNRQGTGVNKRPYEKENYHSRFPRRFGLRPVPSRRSAAAEENFPCRVSCGRFRRRQPAGFAPSSSRTRLRRGEKHHRRVPIGGRET